MTDDLEQFYRESAAFGACPDHKAIAEAEEMRRGKLIVDLFNLRPVGPPHRPGESLAKQHYATNWGTKTALGVYRSVKRLVEEGK